ncbi:MAG: GTP-binding protein YchF [Chloroflexi bacterium]|nr:GTP-binding protein YchF [Chloroflexota bacterium]
MQLGIAGLPRAGKTTVFNALAKARVQVGTFSSAQTEPNRAVVKVPDPRVDTLAAMFKPKSIKPAEVQFVDVAGVASGAGLEGSAAILAHLRTVDALLIVAAAYEDPTTEQVCADLTSIQDEFTLADLDVIERRLDRLDREVRMARGTDVERQVKARELELLRRLKQGLDDGTPARALGLGADDEKLLRGYALLTAKPAMGIVNIGDDPRAGERLVADLKARGCLQSIEAQAIAGRLEMELAELDPDEAKEFMEAMGVSQLSAGSVIDASYRLLDLISFLTAGADEVRAWTIRRGATAVDAAGVIHSDLARGFIRAEVVTYEDLVDANSFAEARKRGKLRSEGKTYVVQDGDVLNILFNV